MANDFDKLVTICKILCFCCTFVFCLFLTFCLFVFYNNPYLIPSFLQSTVYLLHETPHKRNSESYFYHYYYLQSILFNLEPPQNILHGFKSLY